VLNSTFVSKFCWNFRNSSYLVILEFHFLISWKQCKFLAIFNFASWFLITSIFQIYLPCTIFFILKTGFSDEKFIKFEPNMLASFWFLLWKLRSMLFLLRKFWTGRNNNKDVIFPQSCLQKTLGQRRVQKVPLHFFRWVKKCFFSSKTAPKMAS
jgi:hypothetical protein